MLVKSWEQIPFAIGVNNLRENKAITDLPFSISCGTQQGLEHFENSFGNQDAISMVIENDFIVGIVCDGCTSSNINSVNDFTSNQVGANILSKKTSSVIRSLISASGVKSIPENLFNIQNVLLSYLNNLIDDLGESIDEKELLINNFFTTTIIAFAVDKDDYCIFNLGDGIAISNAIKKELKFSSGKYLTSYLENGRPSELGFNLIDTGKTETIDSLFISSDGFDNERLLTNKYFIDFLNKRYIGKKGGFIDGLPEFRKYFLTPYINEKEIFDQWPKDDATYILIRRITNAKIRQPEGKNEPRIESATDIGLKEFLQTLSAEPQIITKEETVSEKPAEIQVSSISLENPIKKAKPFARRISLIEAKKERAQAIKKKNNSEINSPTNKRISKSRKKNHKKR